MLHPIVLRELVPDLLFTQCTYDDANMKAGCFKERCMMFHQRRLYNNSEETASLFDNTGYDRQKLRGLCPDIPVSTFLKRWVTVQRGEHTYEAL